MARPVVVSVSRNLFFPAPLAGPAAGPSTIRFNTGNIVKAPAASLDTPASPDQTEAHAENDKEKDQKAEQNLNHG